MRLGWQLKGQPLAKSSTGVVSAMIANIHWAACAAEISQGVIRLSVRKGEPPTIAGGPWLRARCEKKTMMTYCEHSIMDEDSSNANARSEAIEYGSNDTDTTTGLQYAVVIARVMLIVLALMVSCALTYFGRLAKRPAGS